MGGPGSGKTVLCCEMVWPTSNHGRQRMLQKRLLAHHFCQAHDVDTLSVSRFVMSLVQQLAESEMVPGYSNKLQDPDIQAALETSECERDPDEAFKRAVLFPILELDPPKQTCFLLVDSIDESHLQPSSDDRNTGSSGTGTGGRIISRSIAELLANHHQLFPQWLLLFCSSRKQSKAVNKLFTGFRKISLDDLHKSHVVRDAQQYILSRLDQEESLRQHLSRETAEMLNQLHIKSNGCFLYLETVLNGVTENFIVLREIREIPGTLNGLYLWLCQRLFSRKQFAKVHPILNVLLAARRPVSIEDLYTCTRIKNPALTKEDFNKRMTMLSKLLLNGKDGTRILFHHSFAEWLLDVKHCTQKYLCDAAEGHALLALCSTLRAPSLSPTEVQDFAWHLSRMALNKPLDAVLLPFWMVISGAPVSETSPETLWPKDQKTSWLLVEAGSQFGRIDLPSPGSEVEVTSAVSTCEKRELNPLEQLLASGTTLSSVDSNQRTHLHNAACANDFHLASLLIANGIEVEKVDKNGQTALNLAARQGHTNVVQVLLEAGADPDHADSDGWTPLRSAAWGGHTEVVVFLLQHGACVDLADADQRTALRAAAWGGHEEVVCKLLESGAGVNKVDNEGRTALIAAAYMGHGDIVEQLLKHGATVDHEDQDGRTALSVAALCVPASEGHSRVVDILLEHGAEVDHQDQDGMTPLLVAAFEGHREVCEMLLEYDADVDHMDKNNRTPLFAAASMGHASIVNLLLFFGAAVDAIDGEGRTVLSLAAAQGNVDVVRQLLDRGLDEMHRDNSGWTPLHYAAFEGHREVCEALVEAGARINEVDNDGKHALILAAQEGHLAAVRALVEGGAIVDHRSHDGKTALRVAALEGHRDVVAYLTEHGADANYVDADGRSTLYLLALENRVNMAAFLLSCKCGVDVEGRDPEGRTPLHVAAWQDHREMVELLLVNNADVDSTDHDRRTALQLASWQGHAEVVKILLERNATVDHTCNQGATALCIAAQEGHEDVVRTLLEHGADPGHVDQFGRSPARVASKCGHTNVVRLLEEYGGSSGGSSSRSPGFPGSRSTTSVASGSTAETKPCSAILCPPGFRTSPVTSPVSTMEKRRSFASNPSSSKSSGNLTTSTKSSQNSKQGCPPQSETPGPSGNLSHGCLSFTQQLQQCTRNRNRPVSRLLSPLGEPLQSPTSTPAQSPLADPHSGLRCLSQMCSSSPKPTPSVASSDAYQPLRPCDNGTGAIHGPAIPMRSCSSRLSDDPLRSSRGPLPPLPSSPCSAPFHGAAASALYSPETKLRRNGIVTNPNYKGLALPVTGSSKGRESNRGSGSVGLGVSSMNGNHAPHVQVAHKQPLKTMSYEHQPPRPNGLPLKKETPL